MGFRLRKEPSCPWMSCDICHPNGVVVHMSGDMPLEVYRALVLIN